MAHDTTDWATAGLNRVGMTSTRLLITAVVVEKRPVRDVAAQYGVSTSWLYELLARCRVEGEAVFEPSSRRPGSNPNATPPEVVDLIVELRQKLTAAGLDAGPDTIRWHLEHHHDGTISPPLWPGSWPRRASTSPARHPIAPWPRRRRPPRSRSATRCIGGSSVGSRWPIYGTAGYLTVVALLAVALGFILQSTAGGIATLFGLLLVLPGIGLLLPTDWQTHTVPYLPSNAGESLYSAAPDPTALSPATGLLVLLIWVVVGLAAGTLLLKRRDA